MDKYDLWVLLVSQVLLVVSLIYALKDSIKDDKKITKLVSYLEEQEAYRKSLDNMLTTGRGE